MFGDGAQIPDQQRSGKCAGHESPTNKNWGDVPLPNGSQKERGPKTKQIMCEPRNAGSSLGTCMIALYVIRLLSRLSEKSLLRAAGGARGGDPLINILHQPHTAALTAHAIPTFANSTPSAFSRLVPC